MTKKEERRYNILLGAFRLFLVKEYADVTTADLEEITGLSRGAIYYKVKNKEGLYRAVIDKFVLDFLSESLHNSISVSEETPFWDFIMSDLELIRQRMERMKAANAESSSTQFVNLLSSADFHYEGFEEKFKELETNISDLWIEYCRRGIEAGELKKDLDLNLVISTFRSLYYGDSFCLSMIGRELDIEELKRKYSLLYNTIQS